MGNVERPARAFRLAFCFAPQIWYLHDIQIWRVIRWQLFHFNLFSADSSHTGVVERHVQCAQSPICLVESAAPSGSSRLHSSMNFESRYWQITSITVCSNTDTIITSQRRHCHVQHRLQSVRRRCPSLGPSTQRAQFLPIYVITLINNTVYSRGFLFRALYSLFYTRPPRHGGVDLQIRDGDGSWTKTPHESSSFLVRCRTPRLAMHGLKYPLSTNQRRACARWLSGLSSSMARTGTAWSRAPPLISFDCFYKPFPFSYS